MRRTLTAPLLLAALSACGAEAIDDKPGERLASTKQGLDRADVDGYFAAPTAFILAPGNVTASTWRYRTSAPSGAWTSSSYNDSTWSSGQSAFGEFPAEGDVIRTVWSTPDLWLRKSFTVNSADIPRVVFWGRWDDIVDIYINGVLAASTDPDVETNPIRGWTEWYRYLGISDAARATLVPSPGTNTMAVHVRDFGGGRYIDLGLAQNPMYNMPVTGTQSTPALQVVTDYVKDYMTDHVIPGGVLAVIKENKVVLARGFGYADKARTTAVPANAIFRLASVDKALTRNAVKQLIAQNFVVPATGQPLTLGTRVFPLLAAYGITLLPGKSLPAGMNDITVQQILDFTSGIPDYPDDATLYAETGTNADTFTIAHGVRYIYSNPLTFPPGSSDEYVSTGHMVLRYMLGVLKGNFEPYMQKSFLGPAGSHDVIVAKERLEDRSPREIWYATLSNPWDRWIGLDEFYALSTSAEGLAQYLRHYDIENYSFINPTTGLWTAPVESFTRGGGGVMAGSWAYVKQRVTDQVSIALMFNMGGYFDPAAHHIDDLTVGFTSSQWGIAGPPLARNPVPIVGAVNVAASPSLTWTAGSGATSHDVYFGNTYPLAFRGNRTTTSYPTGALLTGTTYYWRIDEKSSAGTRLGTTWSFTTAGTSGALLSDNFESGAGNWTPLSGTWGLFSDGSQVYRQTNNVNNARASAGSSSWTNQRVTARVKPLSFNGSDRFVAVFARLQDANNYYYVTLRSSNKLELKKLVNGSSTTIATKTFTVSANTWYTVKLEAVGTSLSVSINGTPQLSGTDSTFAAGKIGLGTFYATAAFDDVQVNP